MRAEPAAEPEPAPTEETPTARADALSEEAVQKFEAKEYDAAVALFQQAHDLDPQPNYLFNIGRVYEEKGDLPKAVEFYERFLGQSGVDIESREIATERLRVLKQSLRALAADDEERDDTTTPATTEPTPGGQPMVDDPKDDKRKRNLRISGYTLLGVGAGALIAGGVVGGIALRTKNDADDQMFVDEMIAKRDDAKTQASAADGLFIAGGVLTTVGLVLVLSTLGGDGGRAKSAAGTTARRTTWTGAVAREGFGLSLTHRF